MDTTNTLVYDLLAIVAAYLVGSLSFAIIVSRVMKLGDPRRFGSGNPGATNVLRSGNKTAAGLTLLLDAIKGFIPVFLVLVYGERYGLGSATASWVGLAAFVGHLYPVFFRFAGGKGVATAAGVLLALNPWLGLATVASWLIIAFFFRFASLASIVAAVFAPFYNILLFGLNPAALPVAIMGLLLIWRHEANIRKLMTGTESRIGERAGDAQTPVPGPVGGRRKSSARRK